MLRYQRALLALVREMKRATTRELVRVFESRTGEAFMTQQAEAEAMDLISIDTKMDMTSIDIKSATDAALNLTPKAKQSIAKLYDRFTDLFSLASTKLVERMVDDVDDTSARQLSTSLGKLTGKLSLNTSIVPEGMAAVTSATIAENVGYIKSIPELYFKDINGAVMRSITTGNGLQDLIPAIQKIGGVTERKARNIAGDQTRKAYNMINKQRLQAVGVKQFRWLHSQGGAHPRDSHLQISGKTFSFENIINEQIAAGVTNPADQGLPSIPVNCFTGLTKVSLTNGCRNLWRYWYVGDLVNIQLQGCELIECTPNHPILTLRGWLPANEIQEGDYLVSCKGNNSGIINQETTNDHTTFDQLFDSLSASEVVTVSAPSEFNFNGDIPDEQVDIIRISNKLPNWKTSINVQQIEKLAFTLSDIVVNAFTSRPIPQIIEFSSSSTFSYSLPFDNREFRHTNARSTISIAQDDASQFKDRGDTLPSDAISLREGVDAFAGFVRGGNSDCVGVSGGDSSSTGDSVAEPIAQSGNQMTRTNAFSSTEFLDGHAAFKRLFRVQQKSIRVFAGHVYTLESFNGWYTVASAGIVSKNCKCRFIPILNFGDND